MNHRSFFTRVWLIVALAFVCFASGCSGLQTPTTEVTGVRMVEKSPDGASFLITVVLTNPNQTALPLTRATYSIEIPGVGTYSSIDNPNRTLPSLGIQIVEVPAAIAGDPAKMIGKAYKVEGSVEYEPPGEIRRLLTESYIPLPTAEFERKGKLD